MHHVTDFPILSSTLEDSNNQLVYLFGTGISAALTGKPYSWWKWISDGISILLSSPDPSTVDVGKDLRSRLTSSSSIDDLVSIAGDVITATKSVSLYDSWMQDSFEVNHVTNTELQNVLREMIAVPGLPDLFITTNYDYLLEEATGLKRMTYEDADKAYAMLDSGANSAVIHIHGAYDSSAALDNIIASEEQYETVLADKGAQFIQNILGTRTIVFIGCGKTSEDANISQFIAFAHRYLKLDKPYFFLCREGEGPTGLSANTRVIPYGDKYEDLTPFLKEVADIRHTGYFLNAPFVGRNAYRQEPVNNMGLAEYHFMQERIPFCGREEELSELDKFLNDDRQNLWWVISGQAGSGKSRLTLEFLKRLNHDWFGFFLNKNATEADCEKFIPFRNTVVVIDYIVGNEGRIGRAVECLYRIFSRSVYSRYKLRILFIERETSDGPESWIDKIEQSLKNINENAAARFSSCEYSPDSSLDNADGGDSVAIPTAGSTGAVRGSVGSFGRSSEVSSNFLELFDMDDASVEKMIGLICAQHGLPEDHLRDRQLREEYHDKFEMLHYRPLFVEMFVEAWIDNDCVSPRYDTFRDLLKIILKREQERWLVLCKNDYDVCNAWISIVVLASCIGSVRVSELDGEEGEESKYKKDWNKIQKFIKSNTFAGEQRERSFQYLVNSMCQKVNVPGDRGTVPTDKGTDSSNTIGSAGAIGAAPTSDSTHVAGSKEFGDRIIHPLYPDILKEFMLLYYLDDEERKSLADFLWDRYPRQFQVFVTQCISDFPYNEDVFNLVDKCRQRVSSPEVLLTRSQFLKQSVVNFGSGDTPEKILDFIKHEDAFWHNFDPIEAADQFLNSEAGKKYKIHKSETAGKRKDTEGTEKTEVTEDTENTEDSEDTEDVSKEIFGLLKFNGLSLIAEQYGGWSDVTKMISVTEEALDVDCGSLLGFEQASKGMDIVRNLEEHGYHDEAVKITEKVNSLLEKSRASGVDIGISGMIHMNQMNNEFMQFMMDCRFYDGYLYLKKMLDACGDDIHGYDIHALEAFSQSCRSLAMIAMISEQDSFIGRAEYLLKPIYEKYPDNADIASNYVSVEVQKLQAQFFHNDKGMSRVKTGDNEFKEFIDSYLSRIQNLEAIISGLYYSENVGAAWAAIKTFKVNFFVHDKDALQGIISEADEYLDEHPYADAVPQVYIAAVSALHSDKNAEPVSKEEIEKAYSYMLRFPDSENLRREFFDLLEKSTEAGNREKYLPKQIRSAAINNRMYNPMYLPGIDDVDIFDGQERQDASEIAEALDLLHSFGMSDQEILRMLFEAGNAGNTDGSDDIDEYGEDSDYIDDYWKPQEPYKRANKKIMPNDPCPCGSGKKFKKCCKGKGIYD